MPDLSFLNINFDFINTILAVLGFINLVFILIIILSNNLAGRFFYLIHLSTIFLWIIFMMMYRGIQEERLAIYFTYLLYAAAAYIPVTFSVFLMTFKKEFLFKYRYFFFFINILAIIILANLNKIILGVDMNFNGGEKLILFSNYVHFYNLFVLGAFFFSFFLIYDWYKKTNRQLERMQAVMMFTGGMLTVVLSLVTNVVLPTVGFFGYNWFGQVSTIFLTTFTMYSVNRYKLFDIKVILTEIIIFFILIISFIRIFVKTSMYDTYLNLLFLSVWFLFGIVLIRSVRREVDQKDRAIILADKVAKQNEKIELQKKSLQELLKIKEETLHIVNHQLNTPISIMKSATSMFQDKIWNEEKYLGVINNEIKRITDTIAQFLAAKKAEDGNIVLNKTKTDFTTLVKSLIDEKMLLKKVRETKIKINFSEEENIPPVSCDVSRITEVISNLLDNAINYSMKDIDVSLVTKTYKKQKVLVLGVKDSGIGIAKDSIEKLFQRFTRLDNAQKTRPDGTGLGLYVCKQIITAHGGRIWVESEGEGKGSTFFVSIPLL